MPRIHPVSQGTYEMTLQRNDAILRASTMPLHALACMLVLVIVASILGLAANWDDVWMYSIAALSYCVSGLVYVMLHVNVHHWNSVLLEEAIVLEDEDVIPASRIF